MVPAVQAVAGRPTQQETEGQPGPQAMGRLPEDPHQHGGTHRQTHHSEDLRRISEQAEGGAGVAHPLERQQTRQEGIQPSWFQVAEHPRLAPLVRDQHRQGKEQRQGPIAAGSGRARASWGDGIPRGGGVGWNRIGHAQPLKIAPAAPASAPRPAPRPRSTAGPGEGSPVHSPPGAAPGWRPSGRPGRR